MSKDKNTKWMEIALKEAMIALEEDEVPIGCVIVKGEKLLAKAHNQTERLRDPTAHAEMLAITQAASFFENGRLFGCSLYVTIEPCFMCTGAIILSRIENVYFGAKDPKFGACGSLYNLGEDKRLNHKLKIRGGVLEEESLILLKSFFEGKR